VQTWNVFAHGQLERLTDEQLLTALYVLQNFSHPSKQMLIQSLTVNHTLTARFLQKLDEKNTRLSQQVINLTWAAIIIGTIAALCAITQTCAMLHH
jgi:hypothetical protein